MGLFRMQRLPSTLHLQERENELIAQYKALTIQNILLDIECQLHAEDIEMIKDLQQKQQQQHILENIFVIEDFKLSSLCIADQFVNDNTQLIVKKCCNLTLEDISTKVHNLALTACKLSELNGIEKMQQLTSLTISNKTYINLALINELHNLINLNISNNSIGSNKLDLSKLSKLIALDISENNITKIKDKKITFPVNLKCLSVRKNQMTEFKIHLNNAVLIDLDLSENQLKDITNIGFLQSLTKLNLSQNGITDLTPIYNNLNLIELDVSHNYMFSLNSYDSVKHGGLKSLQELKIANNFLSNIQDLKHMRKLNAIDLKHNRISDLLPLSHLCDLSYLNLSENTITNMWPLKYLNIFGLRVISNQIVDINVVKYFKNLQSFDFSFNLVADIQILIYNNCLQTVNFDRNFVSNAQIQQLIRTSNNKVLKENIIQNKRNNLNNNEQQTHQMEPTAQTMKIAKRIQSISTSNDQNQNVNLKIKSIKSEFSKIQKQMNEKMKQTTTKQIHFTGRVVQLFQSVE
ncbi:leucine-rich_repeat-containing protein [Hexamita inflata]|uniref:Leucine-rich_repeat-containing protein n=1 Tax=Hexamita inflata TaxID=28002 RepID=A0ABP1J4Q1_9EUKA